MLLENRNAIIYGGGGAIGGAVARTFAREGAKVYLAGRSPEPLEAVANDVRSNGGTANTRVVDALDEDAVDRFVDDVAKEAGSIDISFNLISYGDVQQPLMELAVDDFLQPIMAAMRSHFITTKAAARHMTEQGSGVILAFGGSGPQTMPGLGGFKIALDALEGHRRQWACELGQHGIRVVTLKTGGIPESIRGDLHFREQLDKATRERTLLDRAATLTDVGNVAAFVASDQAASITSTEVNISCGGIVD